MFSQTIIIGNVGRDPEMRYTPQGVAVCDFSVAVTKRRGKGEERQEETTWFKVTLWRERAETGSQYIKKGMKIMVIGEIKASAYLNKSGQPAASLELTANSFEFLDSKGSGAGGQGGDFEGARQNSGRSGGNSGGSDFAEDANDIPF